MTGIDLDAIDERWNCATENVGSLAAQYDSAQDVPALLACLAEVEGERDEAERRAAAHRAMTNEANARLRAVLLAALGLDDDGRTSLVEYVARLVTDRDILADRLSDNQAMCEGHVDGRDLDAAKRERDNARLEVEIAARASASLMDEFLRVCDERDATAAALEAAGQIGAEEI